MRSTCDGVISADIKIPLVSCTPYLISYPEQVVSRFGASEKKRTQAPLLEDGQRGRALARNEDVPRIRRPVQLSQEVASYIRELIMSGQLRAGEQLNMERLAKELDTSTTPVREALQVLKAEGFAQFESRRGFRIAPLTKRDISDLFLIQSNIAGELAARAASEFDSSDLELIHDLQSMMREAAKRLELDEVELLNFRFHRTINQAASSPKLAWLLGVVVRYVPRRFYSMIPGWIDASLRDHDSVIEALETHATEAAREAMALHIQHAGELLLAHLERQGFWQQDANGRSTA